MKKLYYGITSAALFLSFITNAGAISASDKQPVLMPEKMLPYTVIAFDEDCNMSIIKQGQEITKTNADLRSNPANEDTSGLEEEEALIAQIRAEAEKYPHYKREIDLTAYPNTIVQYASDGRILRINDIPEGKDIRSFPFEDATDHSKHHKYHPYPVDEREDPNKAGDCAAQGEMDNAPYHKTIRVRNLDNGIVKELRKNDPDRLPDAEFDIYTWDGILFGENWTPSFTL